MHLSKASFCIPQSLIAKLPPSSSFLLHSVHLLLLLPPLPSQPHPPSQQVAVFGSKPLSYAHNSSSGPRAKHILQYVPTVARHKFLLVPHSFSGISLMAGPKRRRHRAELGPCSEVGCSTGGRRRERGEGGEGGGMSTSLCVRPDICALAASDCASVCASARLRRQSLTAAAGAAAAAGV